MVAATLPHAEPFGPVSVLPADPSVPFLAPLPLLGSQADPPSRRSSSMFELTTLFQADPFPQKVSLGAGAYKDNDGKPWILPSVKLATERLMNDPLLNHEYQGIAGFPRFVAAAAKLVLGGKIAASGRIASVQTIRCARPQLAMRRRPAPSRH